MKRPDVDVSFPALTPPPPPRVQTPSRSSPPRNYDDAKRDPVSRGRNLALPKRRWGSWG